MAERQPTCRHTAHLTRLPAFRVSTHRAPGGRRVAASTANLESEVALSPAANVQRTTGAANDIVEFKSDRSHETDVVIIGGGLGGEHAF